MARGLFIYWKTRRDHLDAAQDAARRLQSELRDRHPGLLAALHRRADAADTGAWVTLMETYAWPPQGIGTELAAAIERDATAALAPWCDGERHVETFDTLPR